MIFPATTAFFAAVFALFYVGLSFWVMTTRVSDDVLHGDGGDATLQKRIRSHGNFIEYIPISLILIGLLESSGASHALVLGLLIVLLVARAVHPMGLFAPPNSTQQYVCRGGGTIATFLVLLVTSISLLVRLS